MDISHVILVFLVVSVFLNAIYSRGGNYDRRLARLERKLDALLRHLGLDEEFRVQVSPQLKELVASGRKIEAIKTLREHNPDLGLKEAKDQVEALMQQQGSSIS